MRKKHKVVVLCLIVLILGCIAGFALGVNTGLNECVAYGVHIAKNFVNITFDEQKMTDLLLKYQFKIEREGGII